jgi:hypothetical protein
MRLRTTTHRTGIAALTAGLTAVGVLALPAPASAASDVTATLRVTISNGNSVYARVGADGGMGDCHRDFTIGVAKDIQVTAPMAGYRIQVYPSASCYNAMHPILGISIDHDGQVIEVKL